MFFLVEVRFNRLFDIEDELLFSLLLIVFDFGLFVKYVYILLMVKVFLVNEYKLMFVVND